MDQERHHFKFRNKEASTLTYTQVKIKENDRTMCTLQDLNFNVCDQETKFCQNRLVSYMFFNQ